MKLQITLQFLTCVLLGALVMMQFESRKTAITTDDLRRLTFDVDASSSGNLSVHVQNDTPISVSFDQPLKVEMATSNPLSVSIAEVEQPLEVVIARP